MGPADPPPTPLATTLTVSPSAATLEVIGAPTQLSASVSDQFGQPLVAAVVWTTSDISVASIDSNGIVTPGREGMVTIMAASGTASGSAQIDVRPLTGKYRIQPAIAGIEDRFVDAFTTVDNPASGFAMVLRDFQDNLTQQWSVVPFVPVPGEYTIQHVSVGAPGSAPRFWDAFEDAGNSFALLTQPIQFDGSQTWIITPLGDGQYTIRQKKSVNQQQRFVGTDAVGAEPFRLVTVVGDGLPGLGRVWTFSLIDPIP